MRQLIIVTVHGIHWKSRTDWQTRFSSFVKTEDPTIKISEFRYGWVFGITRWISTLNKWLLDRTVGFFYAHIKKLRKHYPDADISVIAHSYGGWITLKMLEMDSIVDPEKVTLHNVIFAQCPIPSHIQETALWNWLDFGKLHRVFAWCSKNDDVIGKIALKPFGQNGYWGFMRADHPEDRVNPVEKPYPIELYNFLNTERHGEIFTKADVYFPIMLNQAKS